MVNGDSLNSSLLDFINNDDKCKAENFDIDNDKKKIIIKCNNH